MNLQLIILVVVLKLISCLTVPDDAVEFRPSFGRIIGGSDTQSVDEAPFHCSMQYKGTNWHFCGCAIISEKFAITSGHCLNVAGDAGKCQIFYNSHSKIDGAALIADIDKLIVYSDYKPGVDIKHTNDIGLIKVKVKFDLNMAAKAITIKKDKIGDKVPLLFFGWGWTIFDPNAARPDIFRKIELTSTDNAFCDGKLGDIVEDSHLCTISKKGPGTTEGICYGDSGSPLIEEVMGTTAMDSRLVGIAIFANPCANGNPDVFTRFSDKICMWINTETTRESGEMPATPPVTCE